MNYVISKKLFFLQSIQHFYCHFNSALQEKKFANTVTVFAIPDALCRGEVPKGSAEGIPSEPLGQSDLLVLLDCHGTSLRDRSSCLAKTKDYLSFRFRSDFYSERERNLVLLRFLSHSFHLNDILKIYTHSYPLDTYYLLMLHKRLLLYQ